MTLLQSGIAKPSSGYDIEQSLRFNNPDGAYLTFTPSSTATSTKIFTFSGWVKRGQVDQERRIFTAGEAGSTPRTEFTFNSTGYLSIGLNPTGSAWYSANTTALYRDPSAWYHIVWSMDTSQASASNRSTLYVNGEQVTDFSSNTLNDSTAIPQDSTVLMGQSGMLQAVGAYANNLAQSVYDGYLAEVHFIDGQKLTPASFGETNEDTNQWQAIKYAGSYGTNGFYLKFQDSSALGDDSSGNTNDFTVTNLVATDQVLDSPTNNFAVMNPLDNPDNRASGSTFSEGNLKVSEVGGNDNYTMIGNFGMSSGKWYFEFCGVNSDNTWMLGIGDMTKNLSRGYTGTSGDGLFVYVDGDTYTGSTSASYGVSWTYGDVMGVAVDLDNNALYFAKNNTWMNSGDPASGSSKTGAAFTTQLADRTWAACMGRGSTANTITGTFNFGQDSSFAGAKTAQGNGPDGTDLYYDPPSGYIPMCTAQMADPSIADPTAHFDTALYTGNGSTQTISSLNFQPDFVWIKNRTDASTSHGLFNSVMGAGVSLKSNDTVSERPVSGSPGATDDMYAFTSSGFSVGTDNYINVNTNTKNYASWNWKAGGTASTNEEGSLDSSVSANTTAGFSVLTYTGNETAGATVGHGLSQAPELVINKVRGASSQWYVNATAVSDTSNKVLMLNDTGALDSGTLYFNDTDPTSTLITLGSYSLLNSTGSNLIYCWHSVEGYSKIGSYEGNGSKVFIYTGFKPAYLLVKEYANTSSWYIQDNKRNSYNEVKAALYADLSSAEDSAGVFSDFVSNGFVAINDGSSGASNVSGRSYIYLAFAESPFKYSNAR